MERKVMSGKPWYTDDQVQHWYVDYKNLELTVREVAKMHNIKHDTMLKGFRRLCLQLRPSGFRKGNSRGMDGADNVKLRMLWFFKFAYKRRAKRKGLEVTLTDDDFIKLVTSDCHYCGQSWQNETRVVNKRPVNMLTIDRKDSTKGYIIENCVSCCKICNTIKMDMPYEVFIAQIRKILSHTYRAKQ